MGNKFVKLKLINNGTTSSTITLSTILGYEHGGDLIVPNGVTLVKNKVKQINTLRNAESGVSATSNFLGTTLVRNTIETLTITNDNLVPVDAIESFDVSRNSDGSVKLWYTKGSGDNLYNVYIGGEGGKVYLPAGAYMYFSYFTNTISMNFTYFDTSNATYMAEMFKKNGSVVSLDLSMFNTSKVQGMEQLFNGCTKLTSVNLSSFNTSNVTNMNYMFNDCTSLEKIDLTNFDTSNVTSMGSMFTNCSKLKSVDLSSFNTSKNTSTYHMFFECNSLESIDLSNFDTSNVTSMNGMFTKCNALKELDLSNFNTSKVTTMLNMFQYCTSLTKLNISGFDTSNVTNMNSIFSYNNKLAYIDMRNMTFGSNLLYANMMLYMVPNNATIYVKSNTEKQWINTNYSNLSNIIVTS